MSSAHFPRNPIKSTPKEIGDKAISQSDSHNPQTMANSIAGFDLNSAYLVLVQAYVRSRTGHEQRDVEQSKNGKNEL